MLTIRYDPNQQDTPIVVPAGGQTLRLTVDDAVALAGPPRRSQQLGQ
jgi:hypothetical protein